ncbi:MAG TPA: hypothetical protein VKQ29_12180 [Aliidongia sp.]|nr:hypothetical protein [Aliidongia sp.]
MLVRMAAGAPARPADRSRTLVCTREGVWLWPGTPLTERRGAAISALPKSTIYDCVAKFHGPAAIYSAIVPCVEHAAALLSDGRIEEAQRSLDRAGLPPVTPDGALLMRAVGRRLGIVPPAMPCGTDPRRWTAGDIETFAVLLALAQPADGLAKLFNPGGWDPEQHPRWPSGQSDGGRFRSFDGDASDVVPRHPLLQLVSDETGPGIGHKGVPPLDEEGIPKLPTDRPPTPRELNARGRVVTNRLGPQVNSGVKTKAQALGEFAQESGVGDWLGTQVGRFLSSLDGPKSLDDLVAAEKNNDPPRSVGYETHHIVEIHRNPDDPLANSNNFTPEQLESDTNKVRIPYYRHRAISDFYSTRNEKLGDLTPREYLRGKSWDEQYKFGLNVMRKFEVMK